MKFSNITQGEWDCKFALENIISYQNISKTKKIKSYKSIIISKNSKNYCFITKYISKEKTSLSITFLIK